MPYQLVFCLKWHHFGEGKHPSVMLSGAMCVWTKFCLCKHRNAYLSLRAVRESNDWDY